MTSISKKNVGKKFKFEIGEKVLCYQDKHIYEAKCLSIRKSNTTIEYQIHYRGWKPKYDEWVLPERILKYTPENLKLQQELRLSNKCKHKKKSKKHSSSSSLQKTSSSKDFKKNSSKKDELLKKSNINVDNCNSSSVNHHYKIFNSNDIDVPAYIENQTNFLNKCEVKIRIPEDLKTILTDDWELIINQKKLVHLPFKLNIDKILNDFYYHKTQSTKLPSNHSLDGYVDFLNAIRRYFNYFLDKCLLYPSEKQQMEYLIKNYDEFSKSDKCDNTQSNSKDSKRSSKKFKKIITKQGNNLFSTTNILSDENNDNNTKQSSQQRIQLFTDQNSQSETSDSCTSTEISSIESQQSSNKIDQEKRIDFTKLYGAVHLLRLFTKLGEFIFYTDLNTERINILNSYIYDFLKYLSKNLWLFANESDTSYIDSFLLINK